MGKAVKQWRSVSILSMKRILVVGDSLSGGFGLKSSHAWLGFLALARTDRA
jgi:hypothetical protein